MDTCHHLECPPLNPDVVVDITAELAYWECEYRSSGFHRPDFKFQDYVPSLKFAYDTALRCHRQPLETVMPSLEQRYTNEIPFCFRLDWERMSRVLVAVWARLVRNAATNSRSGGRGALKPLRANVEHRVKHRVRRPDRVS